MIRWMTLALFGTASLSCSAVSAPASHDSPLRFEPHEGGRRQVRIESVDGGFEWSLRLPERVFCDEAVLVPHDFGVVTPVRWRREPDGGVRYTRSNREDFRNAPSHGVSYEVRIAPRSYGAEITLTFENTGEKTLTNLAGHNCLGHRSEAFRDPGPERAYLRSGGKFVNLKDTPRGEDPIRTHYRVGTSPVIELFTRQTRFWGAISSTVADNGLILTRSRDGKALIALWFDPASELFQNSDERNMCIHSDPVYGDLKPGERREVKGKLIFFRGTLEQFERGHLTR